MGRSQKTKGAAFERKICEELSRWWSGGKYEDLFWRTSISGGRATVRSRVGKRSKGQHGDIVATGKGGAALLKIFMFELKRGYNKTCITDLVDKLKPKASLWNEWIEKARQQCRYSGVPYWAVISQRDCRKPVITLPGSFWSWYHSCSLSWLLGPGMFEKRFVYVRCRFGDIVQIPLESFLNRVTRRKLMECVKAKGYSE